MYENQLIVTLEIICLTLCTLVKMFLTMRSHKMWKLEHKREKKPSMVKVIHKMILLLKMLVIFPGWDRE